MESIEPNIELKLTNQQLEIPEKKPGLLSKLFGSKPAVQVYSAPKIMILINAEGIKIHKSITDPGTEYEMDKQKEEYLVVPWNQIGSAYIGKLRDGGRVQVFEIFYDPDSKVQVDPKWDGCSSWVERKYITKEEQKIIKAFCSNSKLSIELDGKEISYEIAS
jgi:hypothetical protein